MIQHYQFSSAKFTVYVKMEDGIIIDTAPVTRKFIGQPYSNLVYWMKKFGDVKFYNLDNYIV